MEKIEETQEYIDDLNRLKLKKESLDYARKTRAYGNGSITHFYDVKYNFITMYEAFIKKYNPSDEWIENFYPHKIKAEPENSTEPKYSKWKKVK